jgi:hypothetical protein
VPRAGASTMPLPRNRPQVPLRVLPCCTTQAPPCICCHCARLRAPAIKVGGGRGMRRDASWPVASTPAPRCGASTTTALAGTA